jgi:hypothetical protein
MTKEQSLVSANLVDPDPYIERHFSIASIRGGQTYRVKDVPADRSGGSPAFPH